MENIISLCTVENEKKQLIPYLSNTIVSVCLFIVYKALLDVIYLFFVGNIHTFFYISFSPVNCACGWICTLIMAFFMPQYYKQNEASSLIMIVLNMIYFLPMTTYCSYGGGCSSFLFWGIVFWAVMTCLQVWVPVVIKGKSDISIGKTDISDKSIYIISLLCIIPVLYIWIRYAHCRILLNLSNIYVVRAEAATYDIPYILQYISGILPIVLGMMMALSLYKKKYWMVVILLGITFIDFSIAGHKSVLLFPIIIIGGYLLYRKDYISLILPLGILAEILAIIEAVMWKGMIISLVFRRMGFVLVQLSEYYYRFFSNHDIDFFRQGIVGKVGFQSIYSQTVANVIGNNYETQVVNCNNGLMADAWSGLGVVGIIIMPIIFIVCFRLLDFVSHGVDPRLLFGLVVYYALSFANAQWSTVLLTHGFIIMCVVLIIFPRESMSRHGRETI